MYGKMLVLTFEDNEDDMMSHILSLINTREEIIQMSGLNNHLLNFKGLKIDEVQRVIIRENQEIELTYTEFEIFKLLAKHPGIVFSKEQIYDIVWKESYSGDYNIVMSHVRNIREKIEDNPSKPTYQVIGKELDLFMQNIKKMFLFYKRKSHLLNCKCDTFVNIASPTQLQDGTTYDSNNIIHHICMKSNKKIFR